MLRPAKSARPAGTAALVEDEAALLARVAAGDLVQLAQNVALAGDEGARMREALIAMAATIGSRELAEAETQANEASEHMVLPLTVLAVGFTLFLLYPALMQLTIGF